MYTYSLHSYKEGEGYKGRGGFCGKLKTATLTTFGFHDSAPPHIRDVSAIAQKRTFYPLFLSDGIVAYKNKKEASRASYAFKLMLILFVFLLHPTADTLAGVSPLRYFVALPFRPANSTFFGLEPLVAEMATDIPLAKTEVGDKERASNIVNRNLNLVFHCVPHLFVVYVIKYTFFSVNVQ